MLRLKENTVCEEREVMARINSKKRKRVYLSIVFIIACFVAVACYFLHQEYIAGICLVAGLLFVGIIALLPVKEKTATIEEMAAVVADNLEAMEELRIEREKKEARKREELIKQRREEEERLNREKQEKLKSLVEEMNSLWQSEKKNVPGLDKYQKIVKRWPRYVELYAMDPKITQLQLCELGIIQYLLKEDATIKTQAQLEKLQSVHNLTKEKIYQAMDQLLIKRIMIIAMEGSLDYYRINLNWDIDRDIDRLESRMKEKKEEQFARLKLINEKRQKDMELKRQTGLQDVVVEKVNQEELVKSHLEFNKQLRDEIACCLKKISRPVTIFEIPALSKKLSEVNQLTLEGLLKSMVEEGDVIKIEDGLLVTYVYKVK